MSRLKSLDIGKSEGKTLELLKETEKRLGMIPNISTGMAISPAVLEGYTRLHDAVRATRLNVRLREQISLYVSEFNNCKYSLSAHTSIGSMVGLSEEEILDCRRGFSPDRTVEAVFVFVGKVLDKRGNIEDQDLKNLRIMGYDDRDIAEIIAIVILNLFSNYFNNVADTKLDFPECKNLTTE